MKNNILIISVLLLLSCQEKSTNSELTITTVQLPKTEKWMWLHGNSDTNKISLRKRFKKLANYGVTGVLIGGDHESMFRAAKEEGLQAHIWLWTLNRGDDYIMKNHSDWYSINRNGLSCFNYPPYVSYYRWLCPTKAAVKLFLENEVKELAKKDYIDGVHLDYVRYCDVILPKALWGKYNLIQDKELPEFDFCYCTSCRSAFQNIHEIDPLELPDPSADSNWINFRYNQVTSIVNSLSAIMHEHGKPISAAVFPTPSIAKKLVRQDWINWELDLIFPMVYHAFYEKEISWVKQATQEGVHALQGEIPLISGLYMPDIKNGKDLQAAINGAYNGGAIGISLFGELSAEQWKVIKDE